MTRLRDLLPIAHEAANAAAELARTRPPGVLTPKGDRDYASEVDFTIERLVRDFLAERTPTISPRWAAATGRRWAMAPTGTAEH